MKCVIPENLGIYRKEFILKVFDLLFPNVESKTGYSYTTEISNMCEKMGLFDGADPEHKFIRFLVEVNSVCKIVFGEKGCLDEGYANYAGYMNELNNKYSSMGNRTVKNWVDEDGDKRINGSFDASFLFSYMLLNSDKINESSLADFYKQCLELLGITDVEEIVWQSMLNFDWNQTRRVKWQEYTIDKIADKAIVFFTVTVSTIMALLGQNKTEEIIGKYQQLFKELFADEMNAVESVTFSQEVLFDCLKLFEPRSIAKAGTFYPEEYYIPAEFECKSEKGAATPIEGFGDSPAGLRNIVCSKTGFGKSTYMQMIALCMLVNSLPDESFTKPEDRERLDSIRKMGEKLGVPKDKFVISVPAKMFSSCFMKKTAGMENEDFVELFFDSLWHLYSRYNFYSTQYETTALKRDVDTDDWTVTAAIKNYMHILAKKGKLVLLLDSFDEIANHEMRIDYLKFISNFYDTYCNYPDGKSVGAHIIVTTRQMSEETMSHLETRLGIYSDTQRFSIKPLSDDGKLELIKRWNVGEQVDAEKIFRDFKNNHFLDEYSQNPYMLSVVCALYGADLTSIAKKLIDTLVERMQANNRKEKKPQVQDVLMNIREILQMVAIDTVLENKRTFSENEVSTVIKSKMDTTDMEPDVITSNLKRVFSIFATDVGLIVPADGDDRSYQFINNQIRYQLATDGFRRFLSDDVRADYMKRLLSRNVKISEYTGLLVPLLCVEGTENVGVAEELIRGLVLHDYSDDEGAQCLIRAMVDLVLGRYGTSVATVNISNDVDREDILKCQRMLMMRMLSAPEFMPTQEEKTAILNSKAYKNSEKWLSAVLKNLLTE